MDDINLSHIIKQGLVDKGKIPSDGICTVKIWQKNIGKTIIAHVPVANGQVQETGDFELDGVTFPAAEIVLEFVDPADEGEGDGGGAMFPTGHLVDDQLAWVGEENGVAVRRRALDLLGR